MVVVNKIDLNAHANADSYFNSGGSFGIGIASPDGKLHIQSATCGTVDASVHADELVLEGSGNTGLSILSGNSDLGTVYFGDDGDNDIGHILL